MVPPRPAQNNSAPGTSAPPVALSSFDSGTQREEMSSTATATGRFMRKMSRHETALISQPPSSGPKAMATPLKPDQAPMARERSAGTKEACKMARLPGVSRAAPTPCSPRAATRVAALGATPHSSEAMANQAVPTWKTARRP